MRLETLVATWSAVKATRSRNAKIAALAELLDGRGLTEIDRIVAWLSGELLQGKIGVGYAGAHAASKTEAAPSSTLAMDQVDAVFTAVQATVGKGSKAKKAGLLATLFGDATPEEQRFLMGLLTGELRQGALAGVMAEGIARAAGVPGASVRRAAMLSGDLRAAARAAFDGGEHALTAFRVTLFAPLQPMLAHTAETPGEALERLGEAVLDFKLDGARIQVHKDGERVRVWSRALREVTGAVPEVVAAARSLAVDSAILDGEVLALTPDGRPHPFQTTMRRFGRKRQDRVAALKDSLPLTPFFFDMLYLNGQELIDADGLARAEAMAGALPDGLIVPREVTSSVDAADRFLEQALEGGHEGIMAKSPGAAYLAGSRGKGWLKIKPAHTLDLVVLAVDWGSGRRKGWLSNLHLGARDPAGGFVMLGKTFKGMSDELLAWQTRRFQELETHRTEWTVHVRPEQVVEIAFNEIQTSPRYPGGLALRFARVKRYRSDKDAQDADTIETVRGIHQARGGGSQP